MKQNDAKNNTNIKNIFW